MVSIPGLIGNAEHLFDYIIDLNLDPAPPTRSNSKKRQADLDYDSRSEVHGHVQFPVSVPGIDMPTLNELLSSLSKSNRQELEINWNYDVMYGTAIASMYVFRQGCKKCIISKDYMLSDDEFEEAMTEIIEDSEQLFVAIAYAAKYSLLTTYNMKLAPSVDGNGLNLQADIRLDMGKAKEQNALRLISALSHNIHPKNVKLDGRPAKKSKSTVSCQATDTIIQTTSLSLASSSMPVSSSSVSFSTISSSTASSSTASLSTVSLSAASSSTASPFNVSSSNVSSTVSSSATSFLKSQSTPSQPQSDVIRPSCTLFTIPSHPDDISLLSFYANLHPAVSSEYLEQYISPLMVAILTPFQTQNVKWMMKREGHLATNTGEIIQLPQKYRPLPLLHTGAHTDDTSGIYYDIYRNVESTDRDEIEVLTEISLRGGILADEMGLGKTVSVLGLITKHTLNTNDPSHPNPLNFPKLTVSKATLIIAPGSIMSQWASEIKKHTSNLTVYEYKGAVDDPIDAESLSKYDIVLVYYETFKSEIAHSKPPPPRSRRHAAKYDFSISPLVSILWFRCILDEAQMVESVTATVAKMANRIPRWYSWAVTGTPLKERFYELFGLYNFIQPDITVSTNSYDFNNLVSKPENKGLFFEYTKATMRRNTKIALTSQVVIPKQNRHVVHIPFSTIEQHYYEDLYRRCKSELKFDWMDSIGWELPENESEVNKQIFNDIKSSMRSWLLALRQNCIHPSVIANTALKLGNQSLTTNNNKVQSLADVLRDMGTNASTICDNYRYAYYDTKLKHGGMFEVVHDWKKAYDIYKCSIPEIIELVQSHADKIKKIHDNNKKALRLLSGDDEAATDNDGGFTDSYEGKKDNSTVANHAYHRWNILLHRYYFYIAGVCHELNLQEYEDMYYSQATDIRRLLLEKHTKRIEVTLHELKQSGHRVKSIDENYVGARVVEEDLLKFKEYPDEESDNYDSDDEGFGDTKERDHDINMLQNLKQIGFILDKQYEKMLYLRNKITKLLEKPVIDNSMVEDVTGDEYKDSIEEQSLTQAYIKAYQNLLQDRKFIIKGTLFASALTDTNNIDEFVSDESRQIDAAEIDFRKSLRSPGFQIECIKDLDRFLRALKTTMKGAESGKEYHVLNENQQWLKKRITIQNKLIDDLDVDVRKLSHAYNNRAAFYKSLQTISDTLLDWKHKNPLSEIQRLSIREAKLYEDIINSKSRDSYFKALAEEHRNLENPDEKTPKDCLICQETIEKGMITYCGHTSCNDCGLIWFNRNQRCHTCNSTVRHNEWYNVSYKEMEMHDKDARPINSRIRSSNNSNASVSDSNDEATERSRGQLNSLIQKINTVNIIPGQGAKLDSIIRHIKFIKNETNGKCVVFSQWTKVLEMLKRGLNENKIKCVTLNGGANNSAIVSSFQKDKNINVILLHAKSQSSGLTLIGAQTVFIVEPVFNESLEKQAINRVHRIGQTKETSVFWYIVQDTIEERIQAIHNRKRNINVTVTALSKSIDGGGEFVADDDIRLCFTNNENMLIGNI